MPLYTFLTGVSHRPLAAQVRAKNLAPGTVLTLVREPDNKFDSNAIQVFDSEDDTLLLGYIPAKHNAEPARRLDAGETIVCVSNGDTGLTLMFEDDVEDPIIEDDEDEPVEDDAE